MGSLAVATRNEKGVMTRYPNVEGLTADTEKQTTPMFLWPEEKTKIPARLMIGIW